MGFRPIRCSLEPFLLIMPGLLDLEARVQSDGARDGALELTASAPGSVTGLTPLKGSLVGSSPGGFTSNGWDGWEASRSQPKPGSHPWAQGGVVGPSWHMGLGDPGAAAGAACPRDSGAAAGASPCASIGPPTQGGGSGAVFLASTSKSCGGPGLSMTQDKRSLRFLPPPGGGMLSTLSPCACVVGGGSCAGSGGGGPACTGAVYGLIQVMRFLRDGSFTLSAKDDLLQVTPTAVAGS